MTCPDCKETLARKEYHGVAVDICPACAGIWFDDGEMRSLLQRDPVCLLSIEEDAVPRLERREGPAKLRRCPQCDCVLDPYQYAYDSPVQLDGCPGCHGIWVEDGELAKMRQHVDQCERVDSLEERKAMALAEFGLEHEREMRRQANVLSFFKHLYYRRSRPYWLNYP